MFSMVEQKEYIEQERCKILMGCMERGETKTRELLHSFDRQERPIIENWLQEKENERQMSLKQEKLNFARESNELAKEANDISQKAKNIACFGNKIAIAAVFFSLLSLLISILK